MCDDIALAAHPGGIVGRGTFERTEKERLTECADVDGERETARCRNFMEISADLPGPRGIEAGKNERLLLRGNRIQIVIDIHRQPFSDGRESSSAAP